MKRKLLIPLLICSVFAAGCSNVSVEDILPTETKEASADYILPSDTAVITEVDLSKLNETELKYAYAEIFARHGKIFEDENYVKYFTSQDWYKPNPSYSDSDLTELEVENGNYIDKYIKSHEPTTQAPTAAPQQQAQQSAQSSPSVIVVHDEPYYYEHYWGDNTFIIPDSSVRKLTKGELSGFSSDALALIRNEIYARNGYVFQKQKYRDYFGSKTWYSPNPSFNESWLNATEKYNVQLIKSME